VERRDKKEEQDKRDFELIIEAYKFRGYDKGSRGIYMRLLNQEIRMNRKKIQRLMGKYGLICPIRKANPYRRMAKAMKTNNVSENLVNPYVNVVIHYVSVVLKLMTMQVSLLIM